MVAQTSFTIKKATRKSVTLNMFNLLIYNLIDRI